MASLETMALRVRVEGIENAKTAISVAANKIGRIQHLFKELNAVIIDLENDLNNIEVKLIPYVEGENDVREQQGLGGQEKAASTETRGVQRAASSEHPQAEKDKGDKEG